MEKDIFFVQSDTYNSRVHGSLYNITSFGFTFYSDFNLSIEDALFIKKIITATERQNLLCHKKASIIGKIEKEQSEKGEYLYICRYSQK